MKNYIYLDHAAATPVDETVLKKMEPYFSHLFYNPSAEYLAAREIRNAIEQARTKVCYWLGAKPTEIVFTAGGTEANNLAISGIMSKYPEANIVVSEVEHDSVLIPAKRYRHKIAPVHEDGRLQIEKFKNLIDDQTVLVSVMYANNEVGTIQPIREVAQLVAQIRKYRKEKAIEMPIYLHTDACQAANYLDLHVERLGVDLMTLNGGKIYGPKQSGALYVGSRLQLVPLIHGGGQERNLRSGTENVAGIIGFAAALDGAQSNRHEEAQKQQEMQKQLISNLEKEIPSIKFNGTFKHRLPNNLHLTITGEDNERLVFGLDEKGILVAAGSACSASNDEPSHVLKAIGRNEKEARASLRISMGRSTKFEDLEEFVKVLKFLVS